MSTAYSIRVYKQYFNFASSHFMLFKDGTRESMHGHNYRVQIKGNALDLNDDMVFDFLDIKPIVREVCDSLDHKLLIPKNNPHLQIEVSDKNYILSTRDESIFSIPQTDVLILPIENTSAERIAAYLAYQIRDKVLEKFQFEFKELEVEVEETPGQAAVFVLTKETT
ncbi:MAG: 6-carboxytetrahydropterin synthase [Alphaproteobacteria bacterium]|nr:MAG: 6-carboxytetrahydropterin synthase [Alphaproteobacteria bacterium]